MSASAHNGATVRMIPVHSCGRAPGVCARLYAALITDAATRCGFCAIKRESSGNTSRHTLEMKGDEPEDVETEASEGATADGNEAGDEAAAEFGNEPEFVAYLPGPRRPCANKSN